MRTRNMLLIAVAAAALCLCSAFAWADSIDPKDQIMIQADKAVGAAMSQLKAKPGAGLLVLTNAGHGQIDGRSTESFLDVAAKNCGVSLGTKSLLMVHSSINTPLWAAVFNKADYRMVFMKWTTKGFDSKIVDAAPDKILSPEGWKKAASVMGPCTFGVVSIAQCWAKGASWPLLHAACFHNHFCPGLNAGYITVEYLNKNMPLGSGDKYVFVGAPPKCWMDGLQVLLDATAGKSGVYNMLVSKKATSKFFDGKVGPLVIALKVNAKADKCQGMVLGIDWAGAMKASKVATLAPKGGRSNPMFWIARVKMSVDLAVQPMDEKFNYIVKVKDFSGPAALAKKLASAGADPYALIPAK